MPIDLTSKIPFTSDTITPTTVTCTRRRRDRIPELLIQHKEPWYFPLTINKTQVQPMAFSAALQASTIYIISDGSHRYDTNTYGWVIATDTTILYEGNGHCPYSTSPSALRAETYGALAVITNFLQIFLPSQCPIPNINTVLGTDSQTLINNLNKYHFHKKATSRDCRKPEYDATYTLHTMSHQIHKLKFTYVKSKVTNQPTWIERLHNRSHVLAGEAHLTTSPTPSIHFPHSTQLIIYTARDRHEEVNSNIDETFRRLATSPNLRSFFQTKYHWNSITVDKIDWELHNQV